MAFVTCPCAFRLRRLAHSVCRGHGARHLSSQFLHKRLLWHVHVHFDCAKRVSHPGARHFACKCQHNMHMYFDCAGSHKVSKCVCPLSGLTCQQSSYGDLVQRSCHETSYGALVRKHCIEICCRDLAKKPLTEILPRDLL